MKVARVALPDASVVVAEVTEDGFRPVTADAPGAVLGVLRDRPAADGEALPAADVAVLNPLPDPPSVRDFMIFEDHVRNARAGTGTEVPKAWYAAPVFYFTNPACVRGPGEAVPVPAGCRALDFELEVACVVGAEASDLDPDDPASCDVIAGFLLMNDWSARDLQMREMDAGLGPAKGKDFATSLGPWVVTPDELASGPGRFACPLEVRVNGERKGGGDLSQAHWTWSQVLAHASANTRLRPGDVIGSGTVGTGCLLELRALGPRDDHPWLQPGDEVELRGGPLGVLSSPVV
ncbi:MAG TPA: fumarylacetoacetate hydrolase family protein [Acidimicrobiales bacterium]|nr:fumarylacetoacetate hydrolase family protein [Acidimicrobiales bacterium]